jgi:MFS transporter, OFA family, oxalate/formate antiporter
MPQRRPPDPGWPAEASAVPGRLSCGQVEEEEVRVSAGRNPARVLLAALPLQFAFGLVYSWGALAPFIQRDLHWSALLLSAVWSATPIGYGTGIVLGGRLADRMPPRRLCWAGLGLLAGGGGIALAFPSGPTFVLLYSMLGLGFGGGLALAGSIAAGRYAMPDRVGTVSGLVTGAYAFAAPLQVPIVSILAGTIGWLPTLRGIFVAMVALAALTLSAMPAIPRPRQPAEHGGFHARPLEVLLRPRLFTAILLEVTATPLGAYAFVSAAGYARGLHLAAVLATAAITAVAVGNALGRIVGGAASDRAGVNPVMLGALLVDLVAAALLFLHPGPAALVLASLLAGVGFGVPAGVIGRLAEDAASDAPNLAFGLIFTGFAAGASAGSLVGAAVGGSAAWLAVGVAAIAGLAVVLIRFRLADRFAATQLS